MNESELSNKIESGFDKGWLLADPLESKIVVLAQSC